MSLSINFEGRSHLLLSRPGDEDLCKEKEDILQQIYETFGHLDPFHVAEWTHNLPEWNNPHGSAIPISVEDILKNMGQSKAEIADIEQEAIREAFLDKVLNG